METFEWKVSPDGGKVNGTGSWLRGEKGDMYCIEIGKQYENDQQKKKQRENQKQWVGMVGLEKVGQQAVICISNEVKDIRNRIYIQ